MEHEKTLAELASEQRFDQFEVKFKELVKSQIRNDPTIMALHEENEYYQAIIDALQITKKK